MTTVNHPTMNELDDGLDAVLASPADAGTLEMIVRRPGVDQREVIEVGELVVGEGLLGDNYLARGSSATLDGSAHPEAQLNIMNSRAVDLVAGRDRGRWQLAGDQMFVDLDLSVDNVPTGTRLSVGNALIEVTAKPHTGCAKFRSRFGIDAARWVNADAQQRRRGICAVVVVAGTIRPGDQITKVV
jgi:hypothetical protein